MTNTIGINIDFINQQLDFSEHEKKENDFSFLENITEMKTFLDSEYSLERINELFLYFSEFNFDNSEKIKINKWITSIQRTNPLYGIPFSLDDNDDFI